ncbi:MAG: hypothetical protein CTY37_00710 [Methylotenera sp.]|nr:MAG: hypothetical protein CTY37_00710 [Methylotenera sp.]
MRFNIRFKPAWLSKLPVILLVIIVFLMLGASYQLYVWNRAVHLNKAFDNKTLIKQSLKSTEYQRAYSVGYLQAALQKPHLAAKAYALAEASNDAEIRARAKYALGNVYFDLSLQSANIAAGGAHQQAVAQIELAREAYKGALRLKPNLYAARYNLELLDRLSPEKRTQGWQAETDGVTLQPFKRNGTAMMKDNTRRGLP